VAFYTDIKCSGHPFEIRVTPIDGVCHKASSPTKSGKVGCTNTGCAISVYTTADCTGTSTLMNIYSPGFALGKGCVADTSGVTLPNGGSPAYVTMTITEPPSSASTATDLRLVGLVALITLFIGAYLYYKYFRKPTVVGIAPATELSRAKSVAP